MTKSTKSTNIKPGMLLEEEALRLFPLIHNLHLRHQSQQITDVDFAAAFILAYFALRRPKAWSNGKLKERIHPCDCITSALTLGNCEADFIQLLDLVYLAKKLNMSSSSILSLSLVDIFNQLQFLGIKHNADHYINRCVVMWALGQRPVRLLHHIPTPTEVLTQQASGERVVTLFTTMEELSKAHTSKLTYMTGMHEHSRDPLEFLLHDLKHMENFRDDDTYLEQVGFFRCMLQLHKGKVKTFFTKVLEYDLDLWYELEYVISDMNCYSTHLLRYLFAKLYLACVKKVSSLAAIHTAVKHSLEMDSNALFLLKETISQQWLLILSEFGMNEPLESIEGEVGISAQSLRSAQALVAVFMKERDELSEEEWNHIRAYFKAIGSEVVKYR